MEELLLVNFGGPRDQGEIASFLQELLLDRDVIRTRYPNFLHEWLFKRIAKKRAQKIAPDYALIGGGSPLFADTEELAKVLSERLQRKTYAFHRYLKATHPPLLQALEESQAPKIRVLPLFPQFTYATTGSIARFFSKQLSPFTLQKLLWIRSYPDHPAFVRALQRKIRSFLEGHGLWEEKTALLFSAHGLPVSFISTGDPYQRECTLSFEAIRSGFSKSRAILAYQSKFGRGKWLTPSTEEACERISEWTEGRSHVVIVPLSFLSDHIETLFEIEHLYLPILRKQGAKAYRCPALNLDPFWLDALAQIALLQETHETASLIYTARD